MESLDAVIRVTGQDCLQCLAENMLSRPLDWVDEATKVRWESAVQVGLMTEADLEGNRLRYRRAFRLAARIACLEPHECGKQAPTSGVVLT